MLIWIGKEETREEENLGLLLQFEIRYDLLVWQDVILLGVEYRLKYEVHHNINLHDYVD